MRRTSLLLLVAGCAGANDLAPPVAPAAPTRTLSRCSGSPYATIQDAIDAASTGDVVEVCAGHYHERLTITKDITLRSRDGAAVTTIDGDHAGRTLRVDGADAIIEGFTLVDGQADTWSTGGNVYCKNAGITLRDNVIEGGLAYRGGGFGGSSCEGVVEDNVFRANEATWQGGGLYVGDDVDVRDNRFEANHALYGGGAFVEGSYADIVGNVVVGNTSDDDGAGVYVDDGAPLVDGNTFEDNESDDEGGGLRVKSAEPTITDNLFVGNHADYRGGAVKVSHDEVVMIGNTYVGNSSWVAAGAVLLYESASELSWETYEENWSDDGGALAVMEGWGGVDIEDCTFDDNEAERGGHLYVALEDHTTRLRRVRLVDGAADRGGAVYAVDSELRVENTLFEGNRAWVSGGATYTVGVGGSLTNDVFMWNEAPDGAAMRVKSGLPLTVTNTVFRENTGGPTISVSSLAPTFRYNDFYKNSSNFSGLSDQVGSDGNLAVSPGFVHAWSGDYHLEDWSGVIDKGDPSIDDHDGSRSDMGIHGGPYAD